MGVRTEVQPVPGPHDDGTTPPPRGAWRPGDVDWANLLACV
ncbi:hypothetical protein [Frigoriglobus tundricola]|uniref:Uncharacterized protein n=1 Tax=Frigoriglobus tundricola TaxID=2774151 RepID=A0A6M5YR08_9BACT|nr:hypothetical protein [Frigoriglobus tundricola]QJW95860.1 hypothetical protein FTUN_3414 [Frigoriglobus tundricola]